FVQWMEEEGSDIFWITRKPGSGKSTLMKFIFGAQATLSSLQKWAGDRSLLILSSYFWISGSKMQQSKAGFFRHLLHQAIESHPEFALEVFAKTLRAYRVLGPFPFRWGDEELRELLYSLLQMAQKTLRVAIFIDGLDKYGGDSGDVITLLDKIRAGSTSGILDQDTRKNCTGLKLYVSSRKWNEFRARFFDNPKPKMEILNGADIKRYVADKLSRLATFNSYHLGTRADWENPEAG
ncbi:hypothetical protein QBC35DRAFT_396436, partial [Podospora australis]